MDGYSSIDKDKRNCLNAAQINARASIKKIADRPPKSFKLIYSPLSDDENKFDGVVTELDLPLSSPRKSVKSEWQKPDPSQITKQVF